jgi:hypothetical protein
LSDWSKASGVRLPVVPEHCEQAYHMFYLLLPSLAARQALIAHLAARESSPHFTICRSTCPSLVSGMGPSLATCR